MYSSFSY